MSNIPEAGERRNAAEITAILKLPEELLDPGPSA
jgi:hypothetical protein